MWALSGTNYYGETGPDARWRTGYNAVNRPPGEGGWDLDKHAWQRKRRSWRPMHLVPASIWLETCASSSALTESWSVTRIPHVIDTDIFAPSDRDAARAALGINVACPIVLFVAAAGIHDRRKGFALLEIALLGVAQKGSDVPLVVAGPKEIGYRSPSGLPVLCLGEIVGNERLRLLYCAADVVATPSREDNLPPTAMEAQACGRPVVAFSLGGLPDIVDHQAAELLASPGSHRELADGFLKTVTDETIRDRWGRRARERSLAPWSMPAVASQYSALYSHLP